MDYGKAHGAEEQILLIGMAAATGEVKADERTVDDGMCYEKLEDNGSGDFGQKVPEDWIAVNHQSPNWPRDHALMKLNWRHHSLPNHSRRLDDPEPDTGNIGGFGALRTPGTSKTEFLSMPRVNGMLGS